MSFADTRRSSNTRSPAARTIAEVANRIDSFEAEGKSDIRLYSGKDRALVERTFLFDIFHRYLDRFDRHILDQNRAAKTCLKVPFAGEALGLFIKRGFSREEAGRFFALCFQLRRAYYFIDHSLVGRSPCMKELRLKLWNNVFTHDMDLYNRFLWNRMEDFSTLILGETGTGKGTAAAAIGRYGFIPFDEKKECFAESFPVSFVSLNLSRFSESLIESELFGHKKGAFTGAVDDHRGILDRGSAHGAIFLDEIGEVTRSIQVKLLQVIEERSFNPVGGHETRRFQGRLIAATNRSLSEMRENALLREDFYYRLCSDVIVVPPLRDRIRQDPGELDDLIALKIHHLLGEPSAEMAEMIKTKICTQLGKDYPWPGNVRELEQCIRRILLNRAYAPDHGEHGHDPASALVSGIQSGGLDAHQLLSGYCRLLHERHGTYEAVSLRTGLDRRTVKKYIQADPGVRV